MGKGFWFYPIHASQLYIHISYDLPIYLFLHLLSGLLSDLLFISNSYSEDTLPHYCSDVSQRNNAIILILFFNPLVPTILKCIYPGMLSCQSCLSFNHFLSECNNIMSMLQVQLFYWLGFLHNRCNFTFQSSPALYHAYVCSAYCTGQAIVQLSEGICILAGNLRR